MELLIIIIIICGFLFSTRIIRLIRRKKFISAIKNFKGVPISRYLVQNNGRKGIGISIPSKSVIYFSSVNNSTIFHASEIINCEIFSNKKSISKHSTIKVIFRYIIGSTIGGSSFGETLGKTSKQKTDHNISKVELLISTSRPTLPTFSVIVFESEKGSKNQEAYKSAYYFKSLIESLK